MVELRPLELVDTWNIPKTEHKTGEIDNYIYNFLCTYCVLIKQLKAIWTYSKGKDRFYC